jgi:amidase
MMKIHAKLIISASTTFLLVFAVMLSGCGEQETPTPYVTPDNVKIVLREDIVFLTASELAQKIRSGELTSLEVVDAYLSQIYAFNPKLNALVIVDAENARALAKAADDALAKGEKWGPLHGVPVTIKDHIATRGLKTTSAYPPMKDYIPDFDAPVVERLKDAGAIILGKTNLPALGTDFQTQNLLFGVTNNPWDLARTPGGSSGGESAAVAIGLSPLGIGTDIGGSIRIPAHYTGIFGLKPTENIVPKTGVNPGVLESFGAEFNALRHRLVIGPMARSMDDLKLIFPIIAGAHWQDPHVPDIPIIYPAPKPLDTLKIAWINHFADIPVTKETRLTMETFVNRLKGKGVTVEKTALSDFGIDYEDAIATYARMGDMELGVYMPFYIRLIQYVFGMKKHMVFPFSYEKYLKLLTDRDSMISNMEKNLSEVDALIVPVSATPAFNHIAPAKRFGPSSIYEQSIDVDGNPVEYWAAGSGYTRIFSVLGNPVVTIPIGFTKNNLPIGVQIVGSRWQDTRLLIVAEQLFDAAGYYRAPGGYGKEDK